MQPNHYLYMTIISVFSTIIGFLILIKILKSLEKHSKSSVGIYSFLLLSIIFFIIFLFMDLHKNRIIFEFQFLIKKLCILLAQGMVFSLAICIFFSFIIMLIYLSEKRN